MLYIYAKIEKKATTFERMKFSFYSMKSQHANTNQMKLLHIIMFNVCSYLFSILV